MVDAFPKLKDGGGYELLRTSDRSNRELEVIPSPPGNYTVCFLKLIVLQAKVYIRPLQQNLSLEPADQLQSVGLAASLRLPMMSHMHEIYPCIYFLSQFMAPQEKCKRCGTSVALYLLFQHLSTCQR